MAKNNRKKITESLVSEEYVLASLREFVHEKGSQALAAEALGFKESYISLILSGKRPFPPSVAEALGYVHRDLYEKSADKWSDKEEM